jgi:hypothetical protein
MARTADESTILQMFRYMRPMGSTTEQIFINQYLAPLGFKRDEFDNLVLTVGENAPFLFSCHMDTVHYNEGLQSLSYNEETGILSLSKRAKRRGSNCLGADDTAGIWLITEMVKAGVPGTYIIHYGEESGCIGSSALAKGNPMWLSQFRFAMAFDRAYREDVITHQMGRRTCSDAFARSLSKALGGKYRPDDGGSYTDTNEYAHIIPECTNVSVGYFRQHSSDETQDVRFLIELRDNLIQLDFASLVIERDPTVSLWDQDQDDEWAYFRGSRYADFHSFSHDEGDDLKSLVLQHPELVVDILEGFGIDKHELKSQVQEFYGFSADNSSGYGKKRAAG